MKANIVLYRYTVANDGRCPVKLRITGMGVNAKGKSVPITRYVQTHVRIKPEQWNEKRRRVKDAVDNANIYNEAIARLERRAEDLLLSDQYFDVDGLYSALTARAPVGGDFYAIARERIEARKQKLSPRTMRNRYAVLQQVERLRPGLKLHEVTPIVLEGLQETMLGNGLATNTVNGRLRKLRTMWLDACRAKGVEANSPWTRIRLTDAASQHTYLTMAEVARLATVDMSGRKPFLSVARDTVMLSYYLGGRRFTDLVLFTPENVQDGFLTFIVHKSKRKVIKRLFLSPEALAIIERYKGQGPFLLPLLKRKIADKKELLDAIDGANAKVNLALKVVAALAGINKNMTTRIMRHTVANLIKQSGLSTALASELLDHDDQSTTETYMDSFPSEAIKGVLINLAKAVPAG